MQTPQRLIVSSLLAAALPLSALAADHADAPAAVAAPSADITDLYAWMTPDASSLNLVLNVHPFASSDAQFSDAVQYAWHVNSSTGYGEAQTETLIVCQFSAPNQVACWIGDTYVTGDPSDPAGLTDPSGRIKIFAGARNDPFFMELGGFFNTVDTVIGAAPSLTFDTHGCPAVDADTSAVLVQSLQSSADGGPATDNLAGANVLSIVIQVDKTLVNAGGEILSVWASTHQSS